MRRTLVIVNPASRNGATGRRWAVLESQLMDALGGVDVEFTQRPRDAERLAREGVRAGVERVVVAGGDGTLSEVVTGLLSAELGDYAEIAVLPLGTGGDFTRSLGATPDPAEAIERLVEGKPRRIDAGRVTYRSGDRDVTSYFANVASLGISGLVDQLVSESGAPLGGGVAFMLATVRALIRYRSESVTIRVDGELMHEGPLVLAAAANGRYFGGGMRVAPDARLDDGQLDVVVVADVSRLRLLAKLPKLYRGTHLADPTTASRRGRVIEADAPPGKVLLDIDGEPLGSLPARIELLPGAIALFGCPT